VLEACEEIGHLLARLDRRAPPWARPLSEHLAELAADAERARDSHSSFPRRLLDQGRSLALELAAEPGVDDRLVHEDLHQQNVLWRPDPGEWVAIDPHVVAGTPAYAVAPVLWNQWAQVERAHDPRVHLNLRVDTVSEAAGVDRDRARAHAIVRLVRNALWVLEAPHEGTERELTQAVTIIKAMQPG
jgi:streptomycin 6-kinase